MSATQRIALVSRKPDLARALYREATRRKNWQMMGPIDPRDPDLLVAACARADVAVIEAEELLWLWKYRFERTQAALRQVLVVVMLSDHQLLDVVTRSGARHGLVLRRPTDRMPVGLLNLAIEGYMAIPEALLHRLVVDQPRLDIVENLAPDVLQVLGYLGAALTNRHIAEVSGMAESRVKTLVHVLTRKLRMNNRTAVAVFAVTNGLVLPLNMPADRGGSRRDLQFRGRKGANGGGD